ncbi:scavenger receptor cysteine-rich type 1 protein M130-like [Centropristis striata]|uniref:scavenger receptor cysteine-rich type 1 protein M130-like n=1 Tax=Centropristis striata TaxID=184440 RepID=UPI0027E16881|nr:scavenger receptor cysteine-rich type 1 protein M130-like [Centropristis striata]
MKHQREWRPVEGPYWTLIEAGSVCRKLNCGSAVSVESTETSSVRSMWKITPYCIYRNIEMICATSSISNSSLDLTCSDSVRLVNGSRSSLCSGRLVVKSNQSNHQWSSVCEANFDRQDAEVVCRELGCGAPSVLQGALYGEGEAPMLTREFQCGGNESSLLDCRSSDSAARSCSSGKAVGLTCSAPVRLVGGKSRCAGRGKGHPERSVWVIEPECVQSGSAVRECVMSNSSLLFVHLTCSDSVRLENGSSLCSGRLVVKSNQSNHQWSSVCEDDFDRQDAEVVCRELGCGAPSVLQGALYGEGEAPMLTREFQCGGNESSLLDCRSSDSAARSCSPGKAVGLTCSEPVRLVGGISRCAGYLEVKQGDWKGVSEFRWTLKEADVTCRELDCGSALYIGQERAQYSIMQSYADCVQFAAVWRNCITKNPTPFNLNLTCSDLLLQPKISVSSFMDGDSEAQQQVFRVVKGSTFTISCSIQPQYPGGSFQLTFTSSDSAHNYTQPAVNHSANFLFPVVKPAHQGNYSCVYHLYVFSHNFSSDSRLLFVNVLDPTPLIIRAVVLPLTLLLVNTGMYFYCKASRGQKPRIQKNTELDN